MRKFIKAGLVIGSLVFGGGQYAGRWAAAQEVSSREERMWYFGGFSFRVEQHDATSKDYYCADEDGTRVIRIPDGELHKYTTGRVSPNRVGIMGSFRYVGSVAGTNVFGARSATPIELYEAPSAEEAKQATANKAIKAKAARAKSTAQAERVQQLMDGKSAELPEVAPADLSMGSVDDETDTATADGFFAAPEATSQTTSQLVGSDILRGRAILDQAHTDGNALTYSVQLKRVRDALQRYVGARVVVLAEVESVSEDGVTVRSVHQNLPYPSKDGVRTDGMITVEFRTGYDQKFPFGERVSEAYAVRLVRKSPVLIEGTITSQLIDDIDPSNGLCSNQFQLHLANARILEQAPAPAQAQSRTRRSR